MRGQQKHPTSRVPPPMSTKGRYSGGRPRSEAGPPPKIPSGVASPFADAAIPAAEMKPHSPDWDPDVVFNIGRADSRVFGEQWRWKCVCGAFAKPGVWSKDDAFSLFLAHKWGDQWVERLPVDKPALTPNQQRGRKVMVACRVAHLLVALSGVVQVVIGEPLVGAMLVALAGFGWWWAGSCYRRWRA